MKRVCLCLLTSSLVSTSFATDYGVGVSLRSGENLAYLPVRLSPSLLFEPFVAYSSNASQPAGLGLPSDGKSTQAGAGLFRVGDLPDRMRYYFGARLAYVRQEYSYKTDYFSYVQDSDSVRKGYSLAPTLGLDYVIAGGLSAAAKIEWAYESLRERIDYRYSAGSGGTLTPQQLAAMQSASSAAFGTYRSNATTARILVRYQF